MLTIYHDYIVLNWGLGIGPNPQSPIPKIIILNFLKNKNNFFYFRERKNTI